MPRKRVAPDFSVHKLFQSLARAGDHTQRARYSHQECTFVVFQEFVGLNCLAGNGVVLWRTRRPSPQTRFTRHPQIALVVLYKAGMDWPKLPAP